MNDSPEKKELRLVTVKDALHQNERVLADFFENASIGLHWAGPDGAILRVNQAELNLLGYTREEYVGRHIAEFHVDRDVIADIFRRLAAGETVHDCQARMRCKDGAIKHVLIDASVLWQDGKLMHTRWFTRDVSDRQRADEAQARLAAIVESSQDAIISKTLDGRIVSWNAAAEQLFGYRADEAIGQLITIIIPPERHAEEQTILASLRRGLRIEHYETVRVAKNGRRLDVSLTVSPVRDGAGRIIGASKIARDIASRKRAEQRLATQYGVARCLADSASLAEAAGRMLRTICEDLGWQVGAMWQAAAGGSELHCLAVALLPGCQAPQFAEITRQAAFKRGIGLPGRVWATSRAAWIHDIGQDSNFPRAPVAMKENLHSAFGFPITLAGEVLAVMEFFSREIREPDPDLLEMMTAIGSQIGQYIERRRAEEALRASEARKSAMLDTALDCIISCDHTGAILEFNPAAERTFGYRRGEVLGRDMAELIIPPRFREQHRRGLAEYLRTGEGPVLNRRIEMSGRHANGSEFPVELAVTRIPGEGPPLFTGYIRDITERKRAEQSLREQEQQLRLALEAGRMGTWEWDVASNKVAWSAGLEAIHGLAPGTFESTLAAFQRDIHPEDLERVVAAIARTVEHGEDHEIQYRIVLPDGAVRWVEGRGKVFRDKSGAAVRMLGVCSDITARKQTEERERALIDQALAATAKFEAVFNQSGIYAGIMDLRGYLREVNDLAVHGCGYTREQVVDRLFWDTPWWRGCEDIQARIRTAAEQARSGAVYRDVLRYWLADGSERIADFAMHPIRDASGAVIFLHPTGIDITERKRAEHTTRFLADASAALADLTDPESTLQKVAALAVPHFADWCAVDMQGADGAVHRLAVAHVDPAKVQLAHELDRKYPADPSEAHGVRHVIRTGEPEWAAAIPDEMLVANTQGEEHLRIVRELGLKSYICVPLKSRTRVLGALSFVTAESGRVYDAADVRAAEDLAHRAVIAIENSTLLATLRQTDRRKDEFLAMLAHELRNPLAPIRNAVHIFRGKGLPVPELQWATDVIDRQVHQLTRLVDDLLDVSRITRGKVELRKEPIELAEVINSALEASRPLIEKWGHELTVSIPPQPIPLNADPTRLAQVFLNLLNNAAKYTDPGGRIELAAERHGDQVVVRVKDNGIGIAPKMLPRVFDLFAQVDRSLDRSEGGLGIGLTLVQRLVEMHGGGVEACSAGPGQGSEFIVRLPVAAAMGHGGRESGPGGEDAGPAVRRILVVDDNRDAADSLAMLLRLLGNEVYTAHDGLAAVGAAATYRPDVVLLDIGLPQLNGYEAARRIRQQEGGAATLLIALTGWGQDEDRRRSQEAGFDHHMTKPVEFQALQRLLAASATQTIAKQPGHG